MKKRILTIMFASVLAMATLVGCGNSETMKAEKDNATETTSVEMVETEVETEAPHEHTYTEEVTTPATCLEEGEKTFTCECGDTYTDTILATGHVFENYVSNEDATYEADGTETAKCNNCDETDTRVAEGSMLTYTFEDMEATKYAKSTVNVRSLPTTDGEKLGDLSTNDEVKVTGKCNETGWYRIEYSDGVAYVSDSYLVDNKVEEASSGSSSASTSSNLPIFNSYAEGRAYAVSLGYPIGTAVDNGDGTGTWYATYCEASAHDDLDARMADNYAAVQILDTFQSSCSARKTEKRVRIGTCGICGAKWYVEVVRDYP